MPENILLIRLKSIGDVVQTLPAVHIVRDNFPAARLHFLVSREYAPLLRGFADLNEIIPLDRAAYRSGNPLVILSRTAALVRRLRQQRFSLVIDFQGYAETALLSWLTGAPERWGRSNRPARAWTYTRGIEEDNTIHMVDWNLSALRQGGLKIGQVRNDYRLPADALDAARLFFTQNGLDPGKPTLFIQPFTSNPDKNWPLENYLAVARHWQPRGVQVVFGGGPADRQALAPALAAGHIVAAGQPLLVVAGLMNLSTLVLGGDTGLLHLAHAMAKPVLMLMRSIAPGRPFPYGHPGRALVPPQGNRIVDIPVDAVIAKCAPTFADCRPASAPIDFQRP